MQIETSGNRILCIKDISLGLAQSVLQQNINQTIVLHSRVKALE